MGIQKSSCPTTQIRIQAQTPLPRTNIPPMLLLMTVIRTMAKQLKRTQGSRERGQTQPLYRRAGSTGSTTSVELQLRRRLEVVRARVYLMPASGV
jgi:hypothetical protein